MNRFYFLALILVLGFMALTAVFTAARFEFFVDLPSLAVVIVPALVLSLASFRPRDIGRSFSAAFMSRRASAVELRTAVVFFRALERYLLFSGLFGALLGLVTVLSLLQDVKAMRSGFALLLICVFYSVILILVLAVPFRVAVERRLADAQKE